MGEVEETTVPEDRAEIVHTGRGVSSIEIVKQPVKISISVALSPDEEWYWVEFDCWGQACGTLFLSVQEALDWCTVCYGKNLNSPVRIKDKHGGTLYEQSGLWDYFRDRL